MAGLLYYPYINLPNSDWAMRTLLYYEKICAIVPQEYIFNPENNYEPHMLELVNNELVIPIEPMSAIENIWILLRPFFEYIQKPEFDIEAKRHSFALNNFSRIHSDKFHSMIFYELEELGLSRRENQSWFLVENHTASMLMTLLATVISSKLKLVPITDEIKINNPITFNRQDLDSYNRKREIILREMIPFPENINLKKLRPFKEKHIDLLNSFKIRVEGIVLDDSLKEGTERFNNKVDELKMRKAELVARMNENKLGSIIFGTICGITGAIIGLAQIGAGGMILGFPGFANTIYSACKIERAEDVFDQSGMKYLALADKRLR
jgi:hypothetical protein